MSQHDRIHLRIFCVECRVQLGYYEVSDKEGLDDLPVWTFFKCEECLTKQEKEKEALT